ncbi:MULTISPECIES: hypothetical protein [unclassified Oleiphilus]|jgi:YD repeat-containing protein|nr:MULTISPECIES: hypothetical protein [unclassified Oleiphilus]KZZ36664.1 hypothetical protein A3757_13320 [Oleiphilus sp. HI0117]KZZ58039.1 hypothetical protein A3761_06395 [Oleiphilus sp. HI0123]
MLNRFIYAACLPILLSACDGGSKQSSTEPADIRTGSFIDSPVSGLYYETETQSGMTNERGEFSYSDGEQVKFSIGGIYLGTSEAQELITPFDLSGSAPLNSEKSIITSLQSTDISSFDRVINIATLLQALDQDGEPENGIDLGNAHTELELSTINFYVKASQFTEQVDFKGVLSQLNIESHRTFTQAAQHLYENLDISIESNLNSAVLSNEGNLDKTLVQYSYSQERLLTSQETDFNNDGTVDKTIHYSYDSQNRLTQTSDSASNTVETISYDDDGNILSKEIDRPEDELDILQSYTYQDSLLSKLETDLGNDGTIDILAEYQYDTEGNVILYTVSRNSELASSVSYTYSGNRLRSQSEDSDNDGEANSSISYNYDLNGNILSQHNIRSNQENTQTSISRFSYDSNNRPNRYERDDNQDGTPEYIESYQYNNLNKRTEYKKDLDGDRVWDFVAQYDYDINGNRTQMLEDSDGNGIVDKAWFADYQAASFDNAWDRIIEQL